MQKYSYDFLKFFLVVMFLVFIVTSCNNDPARNKAVVTITEVFPDKVCTTIYKSHGVDEKCITHEEGKKLVIR